jgi:thiol-disulfide isomerase/thioredoxin
MKAYFILLIFIFTETTLAQTSIKAKISNFSDAKLAKLKYSSEGYFLKELEKNNSVFTSNGEFTFDISIQKPGLAILILEKLDGSKRGFFFYIKPQANLSLEADFNDFEKTIRFKGDLANENTFFQQNSLLEADFSPNDTLPATVLTTFEQSKKLALQNLQTQHQKLSFDSGFYAFAQADINYYYIFRFINNASYHKMLQDAQMSTYFDTYDWGKAAKEQLYLFFKNNSEQKFQSDWYGMLQSPLKNIVWAYYYDLKRLGSLSENDDLFYQQLAQKLVKVHQGKLLEMQLANFIYYLVSNQQYDHHQIILQLFQNFQRQFPNSIFLPLLAKDMDIVRQYNEAAQKKLPDDVYLIQNADSIHTLNSLLTQFKGKTVLIDLWGTWCGACKNEFKYAKGLKNEFKDKNLVYLYIANETRKSNKEEQWLKYLKANQLSGYHLIANRNLLNDIWENIATISDAEINQLTGYHQQLARGAKHGNRYYPAYLIVDSKGEIRFKLAYPPSTQSLLYQQIEKVMAD